MGIERVNRNVPPLQIPEHLIELRRLVPGSGLPISPKVNWRPPLIRMTIFRPGDAVARVLATVASVSTSHDR